jgi:hypothetical protein
MLLGKWQHYTQENFAAEMRVQTQVVTEFSCNDVINTALQRGETSVRAGETV